jgi:hypothetical protein
VIIACNEKFITRISDSFQGESLHTMKSFETRNSKKIPEWRVIIACISMFYNKNRRLISERRVIIACNKKLKNKDKKPIISEWRVIALHVMERFLSGWCYYCMQ